MSYPCGRHIIAELYQCNPLILNDLSSIQEILIEAAVQAGAEVRDFAFKKLSPSRLCGVMIISESHLAIHTFADLRYASLDIYTFSQRINPDEAYYYIANQLQASWSLVKELHRGYGEIQEKLLDY